jgi:serine/threonine protein kinase/tetratricopeptide (TPR) repeat protein
MNANPHPAKALFLEALEQYAPEQWPAFLDRACAGQPELRARVEVLLEAHREAGPSPHEAGEEGGPGPFMGAVESPVGEGPGTVIGPYKLLEQIGEGGFGVVFMAEQQQPVRRKVALKILKPGMDTRQVVARFEAERQALALMDHPNIAKVLDGGQTAGGRPYVVMDLVKGVPITAYCDQAQLPPRERLELLWHVCQAVQHAHQKGIIHRDLKPSNVLVTMQDGLPLVKVIDFGIAKALGQQLTDKTLFTGFAQLIGTPLYMSPEQAALSNVDVDTRSDIYSLGVLLYELLTGTTPFAKERFQAAGYDEIRRIIREEEPPRPSTRVSTLGLAATTVSAQRRSDPRQLSHLIRGELDWIVMTCLAKERDRRYQTASSLAADLQRYLHDEPVLACPPSAVYRFRKFARRHRAALLTAGLVTVVLVGGSVVCLCLALWAFRAEALAQTRLLAEQEARRAASQRREQARAALDANTSLLLEDWLGRQPVLTEAHKRHLQSALKAYEEFAADTAQDEASRYGVARAHRSVGRIRLRLAPTAQVADVFRRAVACYAALAAEFPLKAEYRQELGGCHSDLGNLFAELHRFPEALAAHADALAIRKQLVAEQPTRAAYRRDLAGTYNNLGRALTEQGRLVEAEPHFREALTVQEQLRQEFPKAPEYREDLVRTQGNLGYLLVKRGRADEAEALYKSALTLARELAAELPADPGLRYRVARLAINLANRAKVRGEPQQCEATYQEAVGILRRLAAEFPAVPEYRADLTNGLVGLGGLLMDTQRYAESEAAYGEAEALAARLADDHQEVLGYRNVLGVVRNNLGILRTQMGRLAEAERAYALALAVREELAAKYPKNSSYQHALASTLVNLASLRREQKNLASARDLLERARPHHEAALKDSPGNRDYRWYYRNNRISLATYLLELGDHAAAADAAEQLVRAALEPGPDGYCAACFLARAVPLAEKDDRLPPDERRRCAQVYADRAVELLRQALAKGYRDLNQLKGDEDLNPLRQRADFRELLAGFAAQPE